MLAWACRGGRRCSLLARVSNSKAAPLARVCTGVGALQEAVEAMQRQGCSSYAEARL